MSKEKIQYYIAIDDEGSIFELSESVYHLKKHWPELNIEKCSKIMAITHLVDGTSIDYMQCDKIGDTYYLIQEIEVDRQKQIFFDSMTDTLAQLLEIKDARK